MKFGNVSLRPEQHVDMTKDQFKAFFTGRHKKHAESYWREFSKEVAKFKPKRAKVKKEVLKEEPKEDVKEGK